MVADGSKIYINQSVIRSQSGALSIKNIQYLTWPVARDDESGLKKYELQWQYATSQKWDILNEAVTSNYYQLNDLALDKRYRYRVRALNNAGLSSGWLVSDYSEVLKPKEIIYDYAFYPNPFRSKDEDGVIIYELNSDINVFIKIYDSLGHFVNSMNFEAGKNGGWSKEPNKVIWNGTNIANEKVSKGGYIIVISADKEGTQNTVRILAGVIH